MIIGLSGYARSGKDTLARYLIEHYGFEPVAWATILREGLYAENPIVGFRLTTDGNTVAVQQVRLQEVIDQFGWEKVKRSKYAQEIRELMQRFGTEAGRRVLGEDVWVAATIARLEWDKNYVFTDCRFPNEAKAVEERGGHMLRVNREGIGPANEHESETNLDNWNFCHVFENDGDVEKLGSELRTYMESIHLSV